MRFHHLMMKETCIHSIIIYSKKIKMKNLFYAALVVASMITVASCKKTASEDPAPIPTGQFRIEFEHLVETNALEFNTANTQYTNNVSETFNVTTFKYYISNVVLIASNGLEYAVPKSYFLVDASNDVKSLITLTNIPEANYKKIRFTLGVDSTRNVSGVQTGALDQANGMFWSSNSGYIFLKMEGTSPQITGMGNSFAYHIGGFKKSNGTNALQTIETSFGTDVLRITSTGNPQVHMAVDVSQVLKTPTDISFATTPMVDAPSATAVSIANNYADMFTFEHIHN